MLQDLKPLQRGFTVLCLLIASSTDRGEACRTLLDTKAFQNQKPPFRSLNESVNTQVCALLVSSAEYPGGLQERQRKLRNAHTLIKQGCLSR